MTENEIVMPVSPMNYGANGMMMNNDLMLLMLFFFTMGGNGWGNNNGNLNAEMQRGFDQTAVMGGLNNVQNTMYNGFSNAEIAACNRAMDAMQTSYNNQIASMNQSFANAQALDARLDALAAAMNGYGNSNLAAIADLKYAISTEACANRTATANGIQQILTQNCLDKIDAKNEKIAELQAKLNTSEQTAQILADNARQTTLLEQYLSPNPIPAYQVQNPNCCAQTGCGCGM